MKKTGGFHWQLLRQGSLWLTFAACCAILPSRAQEAAPAPSQVTITEPNPKLIFDTKYLTLDQPELRVPDSLVENFHRYNTTEKQSVPYYNLGNFGTAYYPLMFYREHGIGFRHGFDAFDLFFTKAENIRYYQTLTPYSKLDFVFGGKEEIVGGAEFYINAKPNLNLGFDFHRNNFKGRNQHQQSIHNNFAVNQWFRSKNNRYDLKAAFQYNGIKNQENGGWADSEAFTNALYKRNKNFVPVYLDDALNKWNERAINFLQEIRFGSKSTLQIDDSTTRTVITPKFALQHDFHWQDWRFIYKDSEKDSAFYPRLLYDTDSTEDNTKVWRVRNGFYFKNMPQDSGKNNFLFLAGLQYDFIRYKQRFTNQFIQDVRVIGRIYNQRAKALFGYDVYGEAAVTPDYIGDFLVRFNGSLNFKKGMRVAVSANVSLASPTQKEQFYFGNHYTYQNDFKKTLHATTGAAFLWDKQLMEVQVQHHLLQNFIYYDTASVPQQLSRPVHAIVAKFRKDFNTKHIYSGTELYAQWISDRNIIRLPVFAMKQTVYYKGGFISGKLKAQLGFDIIYNTNFNGNRYNPSLAEFYHQDKQQLTFYPIMDVFFSLHVKFTNIFLRMEHVNQGMFKQKGIYTAPDYGYLDRTFRAGLIWQFYD